MSLRHALVLGSFAAVAGCQASDGSFPGEDFDLSSIDPAPYRIHIEAMERILFEEDPLTERKLMALSAGMDSVAAGLRRSKRPGLSQVHAGELERIAKVARRVEPGRPRLKNDFRTQWQRIRSSLFDDAVWYAWSATDLRENPHITPASTRDRMELVRVIEDLSRILDGARPDIERICGHDLRTLEPLTDVRPDPLHWTDWKLRWDDKMAGLNLGQMIEESRDASYSAAVRDVSAAASLLQVLPSVQHRDPTPADWADAINRIRLKLMNALWVLHNS